jgi:hypothetical protein
MHDFKTNPAGKGRRQQFNETARSQKRYYIIGFILLEGF